MNSGWTPLKAIRAKCLECMNGSTKAVRECWTPDCIIYLYRMGATPKDASRELLSIIRRFCLNCVSSPGEVRTCDAEVTDDHYTACPFHPYRMGRRPKAKAERSLISLCEEESRPHAQKT